MTPGLQGTLKVTVLWANSVTLGEAESPPLGNEDTGSDQWFPEMLQMSGGQVTKFQGPSPV